MVVDIGYAAFSSTHPLPPHSRRSLPKSGGI
jgi:hypothetical protein